MSVKLTVHLPPQAYERLAYQAVDENRPVEMQAAVALIRALGLRLPSDAGDAPVIWDVKAKTSA